MKIATIVGARPQFVKLFPVSKAIEEFNAGSSKKIDDVIIHTGQHYDFNMSDIFFEELELPKANYNLSISGGGHGAMTGKMLEAIEERLIEIQPSVVVVYGDTNSTLAGALAAVKLGIPVAHIESGLRSYNKKMPEEINRTLTDKISDILFCHSEYAKDNLVREGIIESIFIVGDVMYDSTLYYRTLAAEKYKLLDFGLEKNKYVLCTVHRQENTDDKSRLLEILNALNEICKEYVVVLPLHPRTKKAISENNIEYMLNSFKVLPPLSYLQTIFLEMNASCILTDSGGVQKEAFFNKIPCITLRDETEWVETVKSGANVIVGADKRKIVHALKIIKARSLEYDSGYFGDGNAAKKIVKVLADNYG